MRKAFTKNEIPEIAKEILRSLSANIIALSGDLGAGKTTLTQAIARELGVQENVVSPTFVIMKMYDLKNQKHKRLIHIDAYRLESNKELQTLGWEEIISDSKNLILIEWPENVKELIPNSAKKIFLKHVDENTREINF